jgi:hypothetical protein
LYFWQIQVPYFLLEQWGVVLHHPPKFFNFFVFFIFVFHHNRLFFDAFLCEMGTV